MSVSATTADEAIKALFQELQAMENNDNAVPSIPMTPSVNATVPAAKKRKRPSPDTEAKRPGWVPKPAADCPVVSWMDGGKVYAVQNPANNIELILKMEVYDGAEKVYLCGVYLERDGDVHRKVLDLTDTLANMWVDKATGVPKIAGLTQTVMPAASHNDCTTPLTTKQRGKRPTAHQRKKRPGPTAH